MKRFLILLTAVSFIALAPTSQAAPEEWVGKQLPALTVEYFKGNAEAGKPMIVEFWATWCGPCRKGIPHLNEIYAKNKDKGLVIIGVSDEEKEVVEKFTKTVPMDYTVALDKEGKWSAQFGITGIPHAFLVDKTGKIIWAGHPMAIKDEAIANLLK